MEGNAHTENINSGHLWTMGILLLYKFLHCVHYFIINMYYVYNFKKWFSLKIFDNEYIYNL